MADSFCIKPGYKINDSVLLGGGEHTVADASVYSYEVYAAARKLIENRQLRSVLDAGCGQAVKLDKLICQVCDEIVGLDVASTVAECSSRYDFGTWIVADLEDPSLDLGRQFDLLLAVDVIEHLDSPTALLDIFKTHATPQSWVILATVERDNIRGQSHTGPPPHNYHVREWNFSEFESYLEENGLEIVEHLRVPSMTPPQFQRPHPYLRGLWKAKRWAFAPLVLRDSQMVLGRFPRT